MGKRVKRPEKKNEKKTFDRKVGKVMHEAKAGTLKSSGGQKVTKKDQAVAIALSEGSRAVKESRKRKKKK